MESQLSRQYGDTFILGRKLFAGPEECAVALLPLACTITPCESVRQLERIGFGTSTVGEEGKPQLMIRLATVIENPGLWCFGQGLSEEGAK